MARLYDMETTSKGIRHVCVKALVQRHGIHVPPSWGYSFLHMGGRRYFAVVEERIPGQHLRAWSAQLARRLGQDLACWHQVRIPRFLAVAIDIPRLRAEGYLRQLTKRLKLLQDAHESLLAQVQWSLQALEDSDPCGDYVFSHGDLHNRNILISPDERLIWLDLDGACRRPRRHDLALAEIVLLQQAPEAIEAFEEGYFDVHPEQRSGWRKHRLGWYRIVCSWRAVQLLTPRKGQPSVGSRQRLHLALSSASWEVKDVGQPSSALVGSIQRLARRRLAPPQAEESGTPPCHHRAGMDRSEVQE